jgi:pyridoxine kinase
MPSLIVFSSLAGASLVGAGAMLPALLGAGIDTFTLPSVTFGRHPGHGDPGGAALSDTAFVRQLERALEQESIRAASMWITGYFASAAQVRAVAEAYRAIHENARPLLLVDPVMGDHHTGAYVDADVIGALETELVPLAHAVCLNNWEAARLTGIDGTDSEAAKNQALALGRLVIVSSVTDGADRIGVLVADADHSVFATTARRDHQLHGLGDLLTALVGVSLMLAPGRPVDPVALIAAMDSATDDARHGELRPARVSALGWAYANAL